MIKEKIFTIYEHEDYPVQAKAYYLFLFSLLIIILSIAAIIFNLLTNEAFTRPGYIMTGISAFLALIFVGMHKYNIARNVSLIVYTLGVILGIFIGDPMGYQVIALFLVIVFFLFFTNKKITFIALLVSIAVIIIYYFTQQTQRNLYPSFLIDHLTVITGFSALCIIMVSILENHLNEKNALIKEIHHRVNNNLEIIYSLISLQTETITSKEIKKHLRDFQNRIYSLSMVHRTLYKHENFSKIDFNIVASEIISNLAGNKNTCFAINTHVDIKNIYFTIQQALPCALILNELVSNSRIHAFIDNQEETDVYVSINKNPGDKGFILELKDNGRGFPDGFSPEHAETIGFQLINALVSQLKATLTCYNDRGAVVSISF